MDWLLLLPYQLILEAECIFKLKVRILSVLYAALELIRYATIIVRTANTESDCTYEQIYPIFSQHIRHKIHYPSLWLILLY